MRAILLTLILTVFLVSPPAQAQETDIQGVISKQIEAFKVDDFTTAFTFAHPSIQGIFQNPGNFGRMVAQGYPMVWRPAEVRYQELRREDGKILQDVQITDENGKVFLLEYAMLETADGWRIAGVRVLETSALSA